MRQFHIHSFHCTLVLFLEPYWSGFTGYTCCNSTPPSSYFMFEPHSPPAPPRCIISLKVQMLSFLLYLQPLKWHCFQLFVFTLLDLKNGLVILWIVTSPLSISGIAGYSVHHPTVNILYRFHHMCKVVWFSAGGDIVLKHDTVRVTASTWSRFRLYRIEKSLACPI